jgi:hypothetical protein
LGDGRDEASYQVGTDGLAVSATLEKFPAAPAHGQEAHASLVPALISAGFGAEREVVQNVRHSPLCQQHEQCTTLQEPKAGALALHGDGRESECVREKEMVAEFEDDAAVAAVHNGQCRHWREMGRWADGPSLSSWQSKVGPIGEGGKEVSSRGCRWRCRHASGAGDGRIKVYCCNKV